MRVLVACEFSGRVREAFRARGHEAWSCDLLPADDGSRYHFKQDVQEIINCGYKWDMMIAHPPCTRLANSGVCWLHKRSLWHELDLAAGFFNTLLNAPIERICVENPIMHKYARDRIAQSYSQIIQPWMFGEDASKATCLWLKGLPPLKPTQIIKKHRYANQTPGGQNKLGPSPDRTKLRSITYQGIANAMAKQWG